jgi:hypothetical protein
VDFAEHGWPATLLHVWCQEATHGFLVSAETRFAVFAGLLVVFSVVAFSPGLSA